MAQVRLTAWARALGINKTTAHQWEARRQRNGFPEPVGSTEYWGHAVPLYDDEALLAWWLNYEPSKGGAPKGNRNWAGTRGAVRPAERTEHRGQGPEHRQAPAGR